MSIFFDAGKSLIKNKSEFKIQDQSFKLELIKKKESQLLENRKTNLQVNLKIIN